ncbi:hypothetical protein Tco_0738149 [Tanacetum coccineum]
MGGMGSRSMGSGSKGLGFRLVFPNEHVFPQRFMMQRYVEDPSIDIPFIFDIDGRTLELGRQDFCLITGFRFGKISLDPKEKDRSQFRERVFPETPNLNGQLLLDLVKNDVAFLFGRWMMMSCLFAPSLDMFLWECHLKMLGNNPRYVANYALYGFVFPLKGLETFSNFIHWWRKDENVIPCGVALSNGLKFEKSNYEMMFYSPNASFQKLTPTSIKMNEPWLKSSLEFFTKVTTPNLATRGSSSSRSVHTCVRKEVRREVHVRTRFHSFVEEEVCTQSVDKEDVPEIIVLEKNVKEQQMQIADMQRRLLSLEDITKRLNNGPSKVDHNVDNNVDHIVGDRFVLDKIFKEQQLVQVGGLDHQSTEVANHCMYYEHLDKSVEAVSQDLAEESESAAIDGLISLQSHDIHSQPFLSPSKVTELINELFTSPNDPGFSQENFVFGYVDVDNMDKDGCITDVKTVARPFLRQRRLGKACDLTRSPNAPTRSVSVPEEIMSLFHDKKKMEIQ